MSAWHWRRRRSGSTLAFAVLAIALLMAWPAAPVLAQAAPATIAAGLLPLLPVPSASPSTSASPSSCLLGLVGCGTSPQTSGPCVLGTLICGGNVISQPTPCVSGLLCSPPPASPCVGDTVLCPGTIIRPGDTSGGGSPPGGPAGRGPSTGPTTVTGSLGTTNIALAFGVPPGVGLVRFTGGLDNTPNPDGFSELLSLSIRDGLSPGGWQLWPALAILQALLLLAVVGAFAARRLLEASKPLER